MGSTAGGSTGSPGMCLTEGRPSWGLICEGSREGKRGEERGREGKRGEERGREGRGVSQCWGQGGVRVV